ncbi:MAG: penicillin acylase family protein, partial [Pseudomonadota bacterium]
MRIAATAMLAVSLMGVGFAPSASAKSTYRAEITRTTYNIPHIVAKDWRGLGYGIAYAYAQDNICMLAEEFATVAGTRSLHWGPEAKTQLGFSESDNLASDIFHLSQIDTQALRAGWAQQSEEGRAVFDGYVAGYNRYLRDAKKKKVRLPEACAGKAWVKPITLDDLLRLTEKTMMRASSLALGAGIAGAAPPNAPQPTAPRVALPDAQDRPLGSNGWAFGSEVTADGKGLLIGNPHFPWNGPARFWQMHATIPGTYDVMGVGLAGTPLPTLGFNKDVAWTHTVTQARHMTLYALTLAEGDPTSYMVDGEPVKMTSKTVTVPMPDGMEPVTRTLYFTRFGPVVTIPDFSVGWTKTIAVALKDANRLNQRGIDTWMRIGLAKNVGEIEAAVSETLGIPWVNTIAADREGNALHADITAVPNVSTQMAQDCSTPMSGLFAARVTLLDGTRSECDWGDTLLPASDQASRTRTDYVTNSNDSYWISNPRDPYRALSPILGAYEKPLSLRTRSNFIETETLLSKSKVDHARAKELVYGNKSLAADMVVDGVLALCEGSNSLAEA